eukprot:PLAT8432.1.p1 GENE.PLAT8432.1~~PLAT8432.1.p1  ORF type:complete len:696 (-),score=297.54 PLAT8432.1:1630-3666(-)
MDVLPPTAAAGGAVQPSALAWSPPKVAAVPSTLAVSVAVPGRSSTAAMTSSAPLAGPAVRSEMALNPYLMVWSSRTTYSDVMAVTVTVKPPAAGGKAGGKAGQAGSKPGGRRRRRKKAGGAAFLGGSRTARIGSSVRAAAAASAGSSLKRPRQLHRALRREARDFFAVVEAAREERLELEHWAATIIQSLFRGHRVRKPAGAASTAWVIPLDKSRLSKEVRCMRRTTERVLAWVARDSAEREAKAAAAAAATPSWKADNSRRRAAKRAARSKRKARTAAATAIQCAFRGSQARRVMSVLRRLRREERRREAVRRLQSLFRGYLVRRDAWSSERAKNSSAALRIQSLVRGWLARRRCRREAARQADALRRRLAAAYIARNLRVGWQRRKLRRSAAALVLQRVFRGHTGRRAARAVRAAQAASAAKLQARVRGMLARGRYQLLLSEYRLRLRHEAATAVQAIVRQRIAKRRVRALRAARAQRSAVAIQSAFRCHRARKLVAALLAEREVAREKARAEAARARELERRRVMRARAEAERLEREHMMREENLTRQWIVAEAKALRALREKQAATAIQAVVRGRQARAVVAVKRAEYDEWRRLYGATQMQALWRGHVARRRAAALAAVRTAARQNAAAVRIQSWARVFLARRVVQRKRTARLHALRAALATRAHRRPHLAAGR